MKRLLSIITTLALCLSMLPVTALAAKSGTDIPYAVTGGNIYFDESTGTITDCDESVTVAEIPSTINGVAVTSIRYGAFEDCSSLTSVTIPDSVTSIENWAFRCCSSLTSITIPDSVTSIGNSAFEDCRSLTNITIPDSVTSIEGDTFYGCSSLTRITIPDSVTSIGYWAFMDCSSLTSITIPDSVTSIGNSAFSGCSGLTSITIPGNVTSIKYAVFFGCSSLTSVTISDGVTSIGRWAFYGCSSLTSITIPGSVTSIEGGAFSNCRGLTSISVEPGNPNYVLEEGVLFDKRESILICYPGGKSNPSYAIPDGVTSIGDSAFEDCGSIWRITIPDSVTSIGDSAFFGCSLRGITIPDSVTSIGKNAFYHCGWLTDVYYAGSESQWEEIFIKSGNDSLTSATIHYNSTDSAHTVTVNGGTGGGDYEGGEIVTIKAIVPDGQHFTDWEGNVALVDPDSEETTFIMPERDVTVTAGYGKGIPYAVTGGNIYFDEATGTIIGCHESVTAAEIPSAINGVTVTSIGDWAFADRRRLTSITIPDSVTSIGEFAFEGCDSLSSITIPASVTSIGDRAFEDCRSLTSITIPASVTSIGMNAFEGCSSLTSITIPASVTSIAHSVFYLCTSLSSITIPASVTSIEDLAFYGCISLTSITIPDSVTDIGRWAFDACNSLTDVYYAGSESQWGEIRIETQNEPLTSATIHYNSTGPVDPPAPAQTYTVTVNGGTGGGDYEAGETITITAIVPKGRQFTGWTVDEGDVTLADPDSEETTFTMPESDVTVTAAYEDIATPPAPAGTYTVTVNGGTGSGDYKAGETVTIKAIVPDGQHFASWIVDEGDVTLAAPYREETTFTMPESNVTVTANYEDIVTPPEPARTYTVTVNGGTGGGDYKAGETVTIKAIVPDGQHFASWIVDEGDVTLAAPYREETTFTMPESNVTVTARYRPGIPYAVTGGYIYFDEATGTIIGCDESVTAAEIPRAINGVAVTSIGDYAFTCCGNLTSVTISDSVTSIGEGAFSKCNSLTSITIPDSVTSIGNDVFWYCSSLTNISVDSENPSYASEDGVLFDKQKSVLICYPEGKSNSSYAIPNGVTSIGDSAFANCSSLTSVTIPDGVTSIGDWAFSWCSSLTSVTIPDGVTSIGEGAFSKCNSLTSIAIPDSVTGIGNSTFEGCDSLTDVYFAGSERQWKEITIGYGNDSLTSATIHYNSTGPVAPPAPVQTYTVTVYGGTGGGDYEVGETVTIRAIVPEGRQFTGWIVEEGDVTLANPDSEETTFTMPECNVTVTATYEDIPTPPAPAGTYAVTVNGGTGGGDYEVGETVTIRAIVPEGRQFTGWIVEEGDVTLANPDSEETTFTMPECNVTVTATYEDIPTPPAPVQTYTVTVYGGTGGGDYEIGKDVTITAIVPEGKQFRFWTVDEGDVTLADPYSEVTTFTMPASDVTVTATYEDIPTPPVPSAYTITFDANGGTVTPSTMTTGEDGRLAELPIPIRDGYTFDGWFTALYGGGKITVDTVFTGDTSVYAHWTYKSTGNPGGSTTWHPSHGGTNTPPSTTPETYPVTGPVVSGGEITISPANAKKGDTVTVTVTPYDGYELVKLTVTDSRGIELALTSAGDGRYTFIMPGGEVTVDAEFAAVEQQPEAVPVWTNSFADVDADAWYYDAIKFVCENGLMNGLSTGQFAPNANLSRAQLAQVLYNKEGKPSVSGGGAFTDVDASAWYADAVTWAAAKKIVGGYGNGAFGPNDNITREQLAVMLWRYAGEPAANGDLTFSDAGQISGFAQTAIRWAVENGILNGKGNNILDPRGFATRAEAAQMLKNYLDH